MPPPPAADFGAMHTHRGQRGGFTVFERAEPPTFWVMAQGFIDPPIIRADLALARVYGSGRPDGWIYIADTTSVTGAHPLNPLELRHIRRLPNLRRYLVIAPSALLRLGIAISRPIVRPDRVTHDAAAALASIAEDDRAQKIPTAQRLASEPTSPGHHLRTERLRLRPLVTADASTIGDLLRRPEVRRYLLDDKVVDQQWILDVIRDSIDSFAGRGLGLWIATEADGSVAGLVGFHDFHEPPVLELLYVLAPSHWGRGLATEMARAAIEYGFGPGGLEVIDATIDEPNEASARVLDRLGLRRVGREAAAPPETLWTQMHYRRLK